MPYTIHRQGVGHSYSFGPSPGMRLLRPLLTSRSGFFFPSPFQAQGEISPGKNALLHCTTAGSTPLRLDHKGFAVLCPLALLGSALYPILVHRLAVSIHASSPHSVALVQLRFTSLTMVSLRRDFHPQECAHAGRTKETPPRRWRFCFVQPTRSAKDEVQDDEDDSRNTQQPTDEILTHDELLSHACERWFHDAAHASPRPLVNTRPRRNCSIACFTGARHTHQSRRCAGHFCAGLY